MQDIRIVCARVARMLCSKAMAFSLVGIACTTAAIWMIERLFSLQPKHLIFIYCIPTTLIASRFGDIPAILATIMSGMAAIYFIYQPRFSFRVVDPLDLIEVLLFTLLAVLASRVVFGLATNSSLKSKR